MNTNIGITKGRVVAAALFVLAGMGLASILSPLVSSALATVGQVVNIADHSSSAYFAKVDSNGALKTAGTVTGGNVSISAPQNAFSFPALSRPDGAISTQFDPTKATLAFTGFRVANETSVSTTVAMYELGEPSTTCDTGTSTRRFLGTFSVPAGQTVDEQLTTPQIVKPLSGSPYWCLVTVASGTSSGVGFYTTYSGYVASGSFTPPVA